MAENPTPLSPESLAHVEAAAAAHRAALELAEVRRQRVEQLEQDLKLYTMELERAKLEVIDLKQARDEAYQRAKEAVEARVAYETLLRSVKGMLVEFVPVVPPAHSTRPIAVAPPRPAPETSEETARTPVATTVAAPAADRAGTKETASAAPVRGPVSWSRDGAGR